MSQSLRYRKISVVQLYVFPDNGYFHGVSDLVYSVKHGNPFRQIGLGCFEIELAADNLRQFAFFKHQRRFVKHVHRGIFYDAILFHVAEKSDFRPYAFVKRLVAAGNDDVGRNAQSHKLLYGMLRRLGFLFV